MYDIYIDTHFAGAHHLRNYKGRCEQPHGHNWKVKVTVRATQLDECDLGIDFTLLKKIVKEVIDKIDHHDLNELPWFQKVNTSSERIAEFIFTEVDTRLQSDHYFLLSVMVSETDTQGLTYYGPQGPK